MEINYIRVLRKVGGKLERIHVYFSLEIFEICAWFIVLFISMTFGNCIKEKNMLNFQSFFSSQSIVK